MVEQVVNAAHGEDVVRIILLNESIKEQWEIVMIIQLLDLHLTTAAAYILSKQRCERTLEND